MQATTESQQLKLELLLRAEFQVTTRKIVGSIGIISFTPLPLKNIQANTSSSTNSKVELAVRSTFLVEYLKGCSKTSSFKPPHKIDRYLPTIATHYKIPVRLRKEKIPSPPSSLRSADCATTAGPGRPGLTSSPLTCSPVPPRPLLLTPHTSPGGRSIGT